MAPPSPTAAVNGGTPLLGVRGATKRFGAVTANDQISLSVPDGTIHATLWSGHANAPQDLGTLGGTNSYARGVNNRGQVVGYSDKN